MKLRSATILILLTGFLTFVACSEKTDNMGVNLKLEIQPETVTDELYVKMNYEYSFSDKFAGVEGDYVTFVHFWRVKNKKMLFVDDHSPEKKIADWKKGDNVKYSRVVFIPKFLDEFDIDFEGYEDINITAGIYRPGNDDSKIMLFEKTVQVHAASWNAPEVVYDEGWWQEETDPKVENPLERNWRWTSKKAVCNIENPKKEALLILAGRVDKIQFKDQKVIFKINDKVLDEFIPEIDRFEKRYILTPEMMGPQDEFILSVESDKTFVPSVLSPEIKDTRELGVRIYRLYFRENIK